MPQLRKDPIIGRWVIISTERAKRPKDFSLIDTSPPEKECPFCRGKEYLTPPSVYSLEDEEGNWQVRVFSSLKPFLEEEKEFWKKGRGPYDLMESVGSHEVVVETPFHIANIADLEVENIQKVFWVYRERIKALEKDEKVKYVLIFKNYRWEAGGGRVKHARSQIIATPVNLKRVKEELEGAKFYYDYHERCVFCDMILQELDSRERVVLEENGFVAIVPFAPRFPFEVWVLPKNHSPDFYKISWEETYSLAVVMKKVLEKIKKLLGDPPYNYMIHSAPFRRFYPGYWSTIEEDFHWHIEITPRLTQVAGFEWGTGFYICPTLPEEAAKYLREQKV